MSFVAMYLNIVEFKEDKFYRIRKLVGCSIGVKEHKKSEV
jgi:hypothetical protein